MSSRSNIPLQPDKIEFQLLELDSNFREELIRLRTKLFDYSFQIFLQKVDDISKLDNEKISWLLRNLMINHCKYTFIKQEDALQYLSDFLDHDISYFENTIMSTHFDFFYIMFYHIECPEFKKKLFELEKVFSRFAKQSKELDSHPALESLKISSSSSNDKEQYFRSVMVYKILDASKVLMENYTTMEEYVEFIYNDIILKSKSDVRVTSL